MGKSKKNKGRLLILTLIFGVISISSYILLFRHQQWVMDQYTLGGWHAAFPVGTAFFFSFIHAAFASNMLSLIGLEAKK